MEEADDRTFLRWAWAVDPGIGRRRIISVGIDTIVVSHQSVKSQDRNATNSKYKNKT